MGPRSHNAANEWHSLPSVDGQGRATDHPFRLSAPPLDQIHDLVGVGFGPASLAIAVALSDSLQSNHNHAATPVDPPKIRFLERQPAFKWHAGMLLPGAKMQISFIKDLATLRDPRSHFTFLNYLKEHDRLVQFTNLGTFLPSRLEFDDYLQWAAAHFDNVVEYGQSVETIQPRRLDGNGKYDCFEVFFRNTTTGERTSLLSRNVVIAAGGQPAKPAIFPTYHDRILHSSEYHTRIDQVLPDKNKAYNIAVIGGGQSGAEVFSNLHARYPNATTRLVFRDSALRPSDDSPFVNEVFDPEAVDSFFQQPEQLRSRNLKKNKATNYSVVRLELLEKLYDDLYLQRLKEPDSHRWQHQILPLRDIIEVDNTAKGVALTLAHVDPSISKGQERVDVDAVVLATGYRRDAHIQMLKDCQMINNNPTGAWQPRRDYSLALQPGSVQTGVGLWLQGCNEATHGLSDSLLSILATRSGELVQSMFGKEREIDTQQAGPTRGEASFEVRSKL